MTLDSTMFHKMVSQKSAAYRLIGQTKPLSNDNIAGKMFDNDWFDRVFCHFMVFLHRIDLSFDKYVKYD